MENETVHKKAQRVAKNISDACVYSDWFDLPAATLMIAECVEAECKGLASRVEELEKCLREMTEIAKGYRVIGYDHKFLRAAIDKAEKLWAGAHAEEKG